MRRAREIWVGIVAQYEKSGLTQEAFAEERGIPVGTLRNWIYRLRREGDEGVPLLPVRVVASPALKAREGDGAELLELSLPSGARLRFPAGTDLGYLRQLAAAL